MKIRSHAQWHQLFQEQITSGQDEAAFCAEQDISRQYFRLRRRELALQRQCPRRQGECESVLLD